MSERSDPALSSARLKSGYGVAEVGLTAMEIMLQVYLLELYVSSGLDPVLAGIALAAAVVWDAVSDPVMGILSDRMRSETARGKRLVFLLIGGPLSGAAFVFLFSPTFGAEDWLLFSQLLGGFVLLNTAMTLVIVPYLALINDLSKSSEDRAGFFGWRLFFSGAGLIVGLSIPAAFGGAGAANDVEALVAGRASSSLWLALVLLLCLGLTVMSVWRASGDAKPEVKSLGKGEFFSALKVCWSSMGFRLVVGAFVFISVGRAINASLALIYYKGTLAFGDDEVASLLIGLSVVIMVATPLWVWAARAWSKGRLCVVGCSGLALLTAVAYPILPPQEIGPVGVVIVLGGLVAASVVLLEALFSDVVEDDSRAAGFSLNGAYYGLWRMFTKVARAIGLAISGLFLGALGYEEGSLEQSEGVYRAVSWAFGPGVALFFVVGTVLVFMDSRRRAAEV